MEEIYKKIEIFANENDVNPYLIKDIYKLCQDLSNIISEIIRFFGTENLNLTDKATLYYNKKILTIW